MSNAALMNTWAEISKTTVAISSLHWDLHLDVLQLKDGAYGEGWDDLRRTVVKDRLRGKSGIR